MPVLLSLILAVLATVGFFAGFYALVLALTEGRRFKAQPRLGIGPGTKLGHLTLWAAWDTEAFAPQVYRFRLKFTNPSGDPKETTATFTFDPPQKASFAQEVELPEEFRRIIEGGAINKNAILTVDFRTIDETTLIEDYRLAKVRKIYHGRQVKLPSGIKSVLPVVKMDEPAVMSLDFVELTARRKRLRELEAAAKAKAAKAPPPKPAAAPTASATTPAAASATASSPPPPAAGSAPGTPAGKQTVSGTAPAAADKAPGTAPATKAAAPAPAPEKPVDKPVAAKPADKPVTKPVERSAENSPEKTVASTADKPAEKAEGKPLPSIKSVIAQMKETPEKG